MRNKKLFLFDEEKEAEKIVLEGFEDGKINYIQMYLVAKYFRTKFSYGEIRLEREIISFCKKQDKNFNPVVDADSIKKWVKSAMKYDLREPKEIFISKKEIEFLKTIPIERDRKLLFIILLFVKSSKNSVRKNGNKDNLLFQNYYLHYRNLSDIIEISKFSGLTDVKLSKLLGKYKKNFIFLHPERELIQLKYTFPDKDIPVTISSSNEILNYYSLLLKDEKQENSKYISCDGCGNKIVKTNNNQKYCSKCSKKIKKEKDRERIRKKRKIL